MHDGESAFALWIPWEVVVLCHMKPYKYYKNLRDELTAEQFMRECESRCTGSAQNPVLKDSDVEAAKTLMCMEDKHCGDPDVQYVIGYDVSYRDASGNAKTAIAVLKNERYGDTTKWDKYKKNLVYVADMRPPTSAREHAKQIKRRWADYTNPNGALTYIVIDAWQYGQSVVEALHEDLGDGLPPFATTTHEEPFSALEKEGAVPCIYPLRATGNGTRDPNPVMLDYIEREFENGNFHLLTTNVGEGIRAYKLKHQIKDDYEDDKIQHPYMKTKELCRQIANLRKKFTSVGWTEVEISKSIPKDMWSATLYAARFTQRLEKEVLYYANRRKNEWEEAALHRLDHVDYSRSLPTAIKTRSIKRLGRGAIKR